MRKVFLILFVVIFTLTLVSEEKSIGNGTVRFSQMLNDCFVTISADGRLSVFRQGTIVFQQLVPAGTAGIDFADVVGDKENDLILITSTGAWGLDIENITQEKSTGFLSLGISTPIFSQYSFDNLPRRIHCYEKLIGKEKAVPFFFLQDGLYAILDGKKVKLINEQVTSYYNITSTTISNMDTITITMPRFQITNLFGDNLNQVIYAKNDTLFISTIGDTNKALTFPVKDYMNSLPGLETTPVPFMVINGRDQKGAEIVLFSFNMVIGGSSLLGVEIKATSLVISRLAGGELKASVSSSKPVDSIGYTSGVCEFEDINGDGYPDFIIKNVDILGSLLTMMTSRNVRAIYQAYLFDPSSHSFRKVRNAPTMNLTLDNDSKKETRLDVSTLTRMDFSGNMEKIFFEFPLEKGKTEILVPDQIKRVISIYRSPDFSLIKTLPLPEWVKKTDNLFFSKNEIGYWLYDLNENTVKTELLK